MDTPFMKFIENQHADSGKIRFTLNHPGQNSFCDNFDFCLSRNFGIEPRPVAYCFPDFFSEKFSNSGSRSSCRNSARFQHDDLFIRTAMLQKVLRNCCCFSRTRRCAEDSRTVRIQDCCKIRQNRRQFFRTGKLHQKSSG